MKRYFITSLFALLTFCFLPQTFAQGTFDFVIETTGEQTEYAFVADDAVGLEVDWGDGSGTETFNGSVIPTHDYGEAGEWTLHVKGQASRIAFSTDYECPYAPLLKDLLTPVSDGVTGITSAEKMFMNTKVTSFTATGFFDETAGHVTDMSQMFQESDFNQDISTWDVSRVTNMSSMFRENTAFNQHIGGWDVSNVTSMNSMFMRSPFNQDIGNWDVGNVVSASGLFREASSFNQDLSGWDVSKIIYMSAMFEGSGFNQDISGWDVSNAESMYSMFAGSPFNQDIGGWDVSNVTMMSYMFKDTPFDQDISDWDVSNVSGFTSFLNGTSFSTENYNKLLVKWSFLDLVTGLYFQADNSTYDQGFPAERRTYMENTLNWTFTDAGTSGEQFDLLYLHVVSTPDQAGTATGSGFYNQGESVSLNASVYPFYQFAGWEAAQGSFGDANAESTTFTMPADHVTVTATFDLYPGQANTYDFVIETTADQTEYKFIADGAENLAVLWQDDSAVVYNGDVQPRYDFGTAGEWTIKVKGTASRIAYKTTVGLIYCPYALMLKDILTPVADGVTGITSTEYMFSNTEVTAFTAADFFDQASANVTSMGLMFRNSSFNQDVSGWDVSNVTNMQMLFEGTPFNQDISGWDVSNVTNMDRMFSESDFNQDISGWNVGNVTNMQSMFANTPFNQPIGSWNVENVTDMGAMFNESSFNQPIGNWDVSNVTYMASMFMFASDFNQDLSGWDVSNVTSMSGMFRSSGFNQDISSWDVSNVTNMGGMFRGSSFDQDISEWDVSNVEIFEDFFLYTTLSTQHYNRLLVRWSHLDVQENVTFNAGYSEYSPDLPEERRNFLVSEKNWTFIDGGLSSEAFDMYYVALEKNYPDGGTVEGNELFNEGDPVTVHATANPYFSFVNWTDSNGDEVSTLADYSFTMPAGNLTLTANFDPFDFELTTAINPAGTGTITVDPEKDFYHKGDTVSLTAAPEAGYSFVEWTGDIAPIDDAGAAEVTLIMPADHVSLTAAFEPIEYTVTADSDPAAAGTVSLDPQQDHYFIGDAITLTATAETGYEFTGWTGDTENLDDASAVSATLTMPAGDVALTATFALVDYSLTLDVDPAAGGTISRDPLQDQYNMGDEVTLTATAESGYRFTGWTGDTDHLDDASAASATLTMPAGDVALTATFEVDDVPVHSANGPRLTLYPTPARQRVYVSSGEIIRELCLVDITGQVISVETIGAMEHEIDVSDLSQGVYFLKIRTTGRIVTKKIQVVR